MKDLTKTLRDLVGRPKTGKAASQATRVDEFLAGRETDRLLVDDLADPAISKALASITKARAVRLQTSQLATPVFVVSEEIVARLIAVALSAVETAEVIGLSSGDRTLLKSLILNKLVESARKSGITLTQDDFSVFEGDSALQKALAFSKTIHAPLKSITKSPARRLPKLD